MAKHGKKLDRNVFVGWTNQQLGFARIFRNSPARLSGLVRSQQGHTRQRSMEYRTVESSHRHWNNERWQINFRKNSPMSHKQGCRQSDADVASQTGVVSTDKVFLILIELT